MAAGVNSASVTEDGQMQHKNGNPPKQPPATKGPANDFVGYEVLIDFIRGRRLQQLEGDLIEVGAFMGGGTAKLARFARRYHKRVYAIDVFDPTLDHTRDTGGLAMGDIYQALLEGRSQLEVYRETTSGWDNIVTIEEDSKRVEFPETQRFMFGFIDGNHHPDYVRNDFQLAWKHLVPGGALGFHDYGGGLLQVTQTIDGLIAEHTEDIAEVHHISEKYIILLVKGKEPPVQSAGEPEAEKEKG